jgi:hypothetical protein
VSIQLLISNIFLEKGAVQTCIYDITTTSLATQKAEMVEHTALAPQQVAYIAANPVQAEEPATAAPEE